MTDSNPNPIRPKVAGDEPLFKCPVCRTLLPGTHVKTFPFCSDRCRLIDLGNWLDGKYSLSRPLDPTDQLDDLLPDNPPPPPRTP